MRTGLFAAFVLVGIALISPIVKAQKIAHVPAVTVPNVLGLEVPDARSLVTQAGLSFVIVRDLVCQSADRPFVYSQDPLAGSKRAAGFPVKVAVCVPGKIQN